MANYPRHQFGFRSIFHHISQLSQGAFIKHIIKIGRYLTSASLEKERGYGIGLFDRTVDLAKGNQSVLVDFNARNFYRLDDGTRLFLRDLAITREEDVIDEIPEAWSSGEINFGG